MISVKEYETLLTEIDEISKSSNDSYKKIEHIQKVINKFRKKHVALVLPSIKEIVANAYGLTGDSLNIVTRASVIKNARQMSMWFYYHYSNKTLSAIGLEFYDGQHAYPHCTVLHSIGKIDELCEFEKILRKEREEITKDVEVYYKKVARKKEEGIFIIQN